METRTQHTIGQNREGTALQQQNEVGGPGPLITHDIDLIEWATLQILSPGKSLKEEEEGGGRGYRDQPSWKRKQAEAKTKATTSSSSSSSSSCSSSSLAPPSSSSSSSSSSVGRDHILLPHDAISRVKQTIGVYLAEEASQPKTKSQTKPKQKPKQQQSQPQQPPKLSSIPQQPLAHPQKQVADKTFPFFDKIGPLELLVAGKYGKHTWKQFIFAFSPGRRTLFYFNSEQDLKDCLAVGAINMSGCMMMGESVDRMRCLHIQVYSSTSPHSSPTHFLIDAPRMTPSSKNLCLQQWIDSISSPSMTFLSSENMVSAGFYLGHLTRNGKKRYYRIIPSTPTGNEYDRNSTMNTNNSTVTRSDKILASYKSPHDNTICDFISLNDSFVFFVEEDQKRQTFCIYQASKKSIYFEAPDQHQACAWVEAIFNAKKSPDVPFSKPVSPKPSLSRFHQVCEGLELKLEQKLRRLQALIRW